MLINYEDSLKRLLKDEGGYSNHPSDPGGPTNFGITIIDYRKYVKPTATADDVKHMQLSEAKTIYKAKYWDAQKCSELPSGVDYCVFDYGVNSGVGRTKKVLAKFKDIKDPIKLINAICDERMAFLKRLKTWNTFGVGWSRRVNGVRAHSLELARVKLPHGTGTVVAVGTGGAAVAWQLKDHMPEVIIGTLVVALAAYFLVRWFKRIQQPSSDGTKDTTNV